MGGQKIYFSLAGSPKNQIRTRTGRTDTEKKQLVTRRDTARLNRPKKRTDPNRELCQRCKNGTTRHDPTRSHPDTNSNSNSNSNNNSSSNSNSNSNNILISIVVATVLAIALAIVIAIVDTIVNADFQPIVWETFGGVSPKGQEIFKSIYRPVPLNTNTQLAMVA